MHITTTGSYRTLHLKLVFCSHIQLVLEIFFIHLSLSEISAGGAISNVFYVRTLSSQS